MSSEENPTVTETAPALAGASVDNEAPVEKKPARRRAPRKKPAAEDAPTAPVAASSAGESASSSSDSPADAAEAPAEKKPARRRAPRKKPAADEASASDAPQADVQTAAAKPASGEDAPEAAAPKRASRSRKAKPAAEDAPVAPAAGESVPAPSDSPADAAEAPAEKKPARRRAPRKKPAADEASASDAPRADDQSSAKPADGDSSDASAHDAGAASQDVKHGEKPADHQGEKPASEASSDHEASEAKAEKASGESSSEETRNSAEGKPSDESRKSSQGRRSSEGKQNSDRNRDRSKRHERERENQRDRRDARNQRRNKRGREKERNQPVVPQTKKEDLEALKVVDLRAKAAELEIDSKGMLKAALVDAIYAALVKKEGFQDVEGVLDIMSDGYGFLRSKGYLPGEKDAYLNASMIRRNGLRKGDYVVGQVRPARSNEKFPAVQRISTVNGVPVEELGKRVKFSELTPVFPDERLIMEHGKNTITARVIDLTAPIGKGQRGLIVSPPKAGKTTILKDIAAAITANNPEVHLMCLLVDERPEEVTDMERSVKGEVIASTFDMPAENHIAVAEMVIERAKRMVENGEDVVILLDSITRLARAYNLAQPASGRILSGGVDSTALYPPKRFLGAARNIENGGSLTILASALIDTGSKMDEVIFEEFKGTGNMELKLDRNLADRRIFPAIDPISSGTRKEDLLMDPQEAPLIWGVRRVLANFNNTERAMDTLIKSLRKTDNNQEFLIRMAKKLQGRKGDELSEL